MRKIQLRRGNVNKRDIERALLTDTSPDDVPIVVSNDGFHANLKRTSSPELKEIIDGLIRCNKERYTIPYRYRIHQSQTSSRPLSLIHPAAQLRACLFYQDYGHLIPYFCRHQDISLRRPTKIGSAMFYRNKTSEKKRYKGTSIDLLLQDRTVRNPGSFFVYEYHNRLYKFYDSAEFVELEKQFGFMRIGDVSKCFASIYSHTLAWAVKDVQHGKENTNAVSFANEFDHLMQFSNYSETNGIPVGAELSRIFAEIILQSADVGLIRLAQKAGLNYGTDFAVRRYVDDYVIFAHSVNALDQIERSLAETLSTFNLHLNEAKTDTISRPLQTRKSQIIAEAKFGVNNFKSRVSSVNVATQARAPNRIRSVPDVVRAFIEDIKAACTRVGVGYDGVSPYITGSVASVVEELIESFQEVRRSGVVMPWAYTNAFEALLSSLYFFFTVHITVVESFRVAKITILSIRFFKKYLPSQIDALHEIIRCLIADVIASPALRNVNRSDCVPIEVMNIILASSELPAAHRADLNDIPSRVLDNERLDYFSYVSLLFFFRDENQEFLNRVETELVRRFIPFASPKKDAHDAHFMLDLIACPYLSKAFRMKLLIALYKSLELSLGTVVSRESLIKEVEENPWFVNWRQIDLLNHLRKKELIAAY